MVSKQRPVTRKKIEPSRHRVPRGMVVGSLAQIFEYMTGLYRFRLRPISVECWKQENPSLRRNCTSAFRTKVLMPTPFLPSRSRHFAHVFYVPLEKYLMTGCSIYLVSLARNLVSLKVEIKRTGKNLTTKLCNGKKRAKKHFDIRFSLRVHKNRVPKFRV